jgi:hypothetical protein
MVLALRWAFSKDSRTDSGLLYTSLTVVFYPCWKVFTARYGLIACIKQITLAFERLGGSSTATVGHVTDHTAVYKFSRRT